MLDRDLIIQNYIDGYNQFDVQKMIAGFDENIIFQNIENEQVNLTLHGIEEFKTQANKAKSFFTTRQQTIKSITHFENETEVEIEYNAILAIDLPTGLVAGQELKLIGRSIFEFAGSKIIKLTDIN